MIQTIYKRKDIPNKEGFKFIAFLADGTAFENVVTKKPNGCHTCEQFKDIIGWLPIDLKQPQKPIIPNSYKTIDEVINQLVKVGAITQSLARSQKYLLQCGGGVLAEIKPLYTVDQKNSVYIINC